MHQVGEVMAPKEERYGDCHGNLIVGLLLAQSLSTVSRKRRFFVMVHLRRVTRFDA